MINLFIYLINDFEKIDITLFKLICFNNVDNIKYKIILIQVKKYLISFFEIYKLMFIIIMKFLIHLNEINNVENFDFNFDMILL